MNKSLFKSLTRGLMTMSSESSKTEEEIQEQEGYICPSCMDNFETPDDLMNHHGEKHSNLCPICFSGFGSAEELQKHFSTEHSENDQISSSLEMKKSSEPLQKSSVDPAYDVSLDKKTVETLKQTSLKLLQEINLLKGCLKKSDEPDSDAGILSFNDDDYELFTSNDGEIVQFCIKTLKTQEIEFTVSKQIQRELEESLKKMEKDHQKLQDNLEKLLKEKDQILEEFDKLLSIKDESLKVQKEKLLTKET